MERNFRNSYYGKMAVRGIEDKKTLENLLKNETIDEEQLANYCMKHPVPAMYRFLVWKILLGILPFHEQSHIFVMRQRKEQYQGLQHALEVMRKVDDSTSQAKVFLIAFLLETGNLGLQLYHEDWHDNFLSIASAVVKMRDDNVDGYWLSVKLYRIMELFQRDYEIYERDFKSTIFNVLKRENSKLLDHFSNIEGLLNDIPYQSWFKNCFAESIPPEGGLERIWDVIITGSFEIMPYIVAQIMLFFDRRLLKLTDNNEIIKILTANTENVGEVITCKGIDLWRKYEKS